MEGWTGDHREGDDSEPILADIAHIPYDVPFKGVKAFRDMFEGRFSSVEQSGPAILIVVPTRVQAHHLRREFAHRSEVKVFSVSENCAGVRADIVIAAPLPDFWPPHQKEQADREIRSRFKSRLMPNGLFIQL